MSRARTCAPASSQVESLNEAAAKVHKGLRIFVRDESPLASIDERLTGPRRRRGVAGGDARAEGGRGRDPPARPLRRHPRARRRAEGGRRAWWRWSTCKRLLSTPCPQFGDSVEATPPLTWPLPACGERRARAQACCQASPHFQFDANISRNSRRFSQTFSRICLWASSGISRRCSRKGLKFRMPASFVRRFPLFQVPPPELAGAAVPGLQDSIAE